MRKKVDIYPTYLTREQEYSLQKFPFLMVLEKLKVHMQRKIASVPYTIHKYYLHNYEDQKNVKLLEESIKVFPSCASWQYIFEYDTESRRISNKQLGLYQMKMQKKLSTK